MMTDYQTRPGLASFGNSSSLIRSEQNIHRFRPRIPSKRRFEAIESSLMDQHTDAPPPKRQHTSTPKGLKIASPSNLPVIKETPSTPLPPTTPKSTSPTSTQPTQVKQSQHSQIAKSVMGSIASTKNGTLAVPKPSTPQINGTETPRAGITPAGSAPNSPRIRPLTLDIPGLTKSRISPDGRIASIDIGAKLVIVMVGLPARGKSYITKKLARYLNWLQHDTKIFNVGHRRRMAAGVEVGKTASTPTEDMPKEPVGLHLGTSLMTPELSTGITTPAEMDLDHEHIDQSSKFFDPANRAAAQMREQVAMSTLDELLHYIMVEGGSVGIFDATNSTLKRRQAIVDKIRAVAGPDLGILFCESECHDQKLLEANMRLKLSGPDYKGMDAEKALRDFKERVEIYEKQYVPVGKWEEDGGHSYLKMIDVGRKVVIHGKLGFLASQTASYLMNFHLSQRQMWITRHGESMDNVSGRIGGDANLTPDGVQYAQDLANFLKHQRELFREKQIKQHRAVADSDTTYRGDTTPPNPEYTDTTTQDGEGIPLEKNFCVWTSMLRRAIETGEFFNPDEFDVKEMRMLDELNAGRMEGMTYQEIEKTYPQEFALRYSDKLRYRYPGLGGESYLDVINRVRPVIHEIERMTEHICVITHRVVARVLLGYFMGLGREEVATLNVPLGHLFVIEPKPYGVDFRVYKHDPETRWFDLVPNFDFHGAQLLK